jgi:glycosyltransferase involved in cell wall biosynthesis
MERFRFVGLVDHQRVPGYLALADLVLLPSEVEIQPLACLEAQACGRVVLASDIPANRELIVDGETGLLFPMGNVDALADATLRAVRSPLMREVVGQQARRSAQHHDVGLVVDAYLATLRQVAAAGGLP